MPDCLCTDGRRVACIYQKAFRWQADEGTLLLLRTTLSPRIAFLLVHHKGGPIESRGEGLFPVSAPDLLKCV
jgi:hypothetical protein